MTNEELAAAIRDGDDSKRQILWERVKRFVYRQAHRKLESLCDDRGVTVDDLAQAGYIAMEMAARRFDMSMGPKFLTYMDWYLKKEFTTVLHTKTKKQVMDPINHCTFFSDMGTEDDSDPLEYAIADSGGEVPYRTIEDEDQTAAVARALHGMVNALPSQQREVIVRRYYLNETYDTIGSSMGVHHSRVQSIEHAALRRMRHPKYNKELRRALR